MAEKYKKYRLRFAPGKQRAFLEACISTLGAPKEVAGLLGVSERTLADWKREKFLMSASAAKLLSAKSGVDIPPGTTAENKYWYTRKGARLGGLASYKKYGRVGVDEKTRKERWKEWWRKRGQFNDNPILKPKPVRKPRRNASLAEFIGIAMGDGSLTPSQMTTTLHHIDDAEYCRFVAKLIKKLFGVRPAIYHSEKNSVNDIVVSRVELVRYLHGLGLPIGHKIRQGLDIPSWIRRDKKLSIACVRGLVDTDGSVFTHRYKVKGKIYSYKKLAFASASTPLLFSVFTILKNIGLKPRIVPGESVRLDDQGDVKKYLKIISSHNPKHLKRYRE